MKQLLKPLVFSLLFSPLNTLTMTPPSVHEKTKPKTPQEIVEKGKKKIMEQHTSEKKKEFDPKQLVKNAKEKAGTTLENINAEAQDIASQMDIFTAARQGNVPAIKQYLHNNVSPNSTDANGNTPLHYALTVQTAQALVDAGAKVNAQNNMGITALHTNVLLGRIALVEYLLGNGANATIADKNGLTPLHLATAISYFEDPKRALSGTIGTKVTGKQVLAVVIAVIILAGVGLFAALTGPLGSSMLVAGPLVGTSAGAGISASAAIVVAAAVIDVIATVDISIRIDILVDLLKKGKADPNAQDINGNTALHILADGSVLDIGVRHGGVIMAQTLISLGARLDIRNNVRTKDFPNGQTAYDIAKLNNRQDLWPILDPATQQEKVDRAKTKLDATVKTTVDTVKNPKPLQESKRPVDGPQKLH